MPMPKKERFFALTVQPTLAADALSLPADPRRTRPRPRTLPYTRVAPPWRAGWGARRDDGSAPIARSRESGFAPPPTVRDGAAHAREDRPE